MNSKPIRPSLAWHFRLFNTSLRSRVLSATMVVLIGAFIVLVWQTVSVAHRDAETALRGHLTDKLADLKNILTDAAIIQDYSAIQEQLRRFSVSNKVLEAAFIDSQSRILSVRTRHARPDRPEWFAQLTHFGAQEATGDIVIGGTAYGQARLVLSPFVQEDALWHQASRLAVWIASAPVLLGLLIYALLGVNLKGLFSLQRAARKFEAGDYAARVDFLPSHPPELRETALAFNHMGAAIDTLMTGMNEQQKALHHAAIVSETDLDGTITDVNDLFCAISGYAREELIGQNHRLIRSPEHPPAFFAALWQTISEGRIWQGEICNRAKNGAPYWVSTSITPILGEDGLPCKYLSIRFDITALKSAQAGLENEKVRWETTLVSISDAVIVTDHNQHILFINPAAESMLGVTRADALARPVNQFLHLLDTADKEDPNLIESVAARHSSHGSWDIQTPSGRTLAVNYSCAPLASHDLASTVYVLRDETEKKQLLDNLRNMAFHDSLTTLPNRRAVEGRLARALRMANESGQSQAFCYIDLDHFKLVNDTCGHAAGDILLASLSKQMQHVLPKNAYLGRLGGDEFGLILSDTAEAEARAVCAQLIRTIRDHPFEHKGRRFNLNACIGIATMGGQTVTIGDLMIQADMACYRAKAEGSGRIKVYEIDEIGFKRLEKEMSWAADFAKALESGQFMPYRQLIQTTSSRGKSHYEVLIRVIRENGEVEGPGSLLMALERFSQAPILDRWMTEKVIEYLARTPDEQAVYFINLSGKTLVDDNFLETVYSLLDQYQLPGSRIGFEITETAAVHNLESAQHLILGLRRRGCQFALDDFGQEASSFAYLKSLPADYIKIDGAFVRGMANDRRDQAIIRSITQLAHDFGMQTVAEQVETGEVAVLLQAMGVNYLQGYHIRRPEPLPGWANTIKENVHEDTDVACSGMLAAINNS
jgi:diguanylate cyclase (GGDEF)-like protein/PAS domain S-box-containing protein